MRAKAGKKVDAYKHPLANFRHPHWEARDKMHAGTQIDLKNPFYKRLHEHKDA